MPLSIKDPKTDALARELAKLTGESITAAVKRALKDRLAVELRRRGLPGQIERERLDEVLKRLDSYPVVDNRSPDELIGYDEFGLPR